MFRVGSESKSSVFFGRKRMPTEITQWIPPAVIVGVMLYLHRVTRQDIKELRGRMDTGIDDLRDRTGRLEGRMARLEGTLDVLREFLVRNGRGNAA